VVDPDRGVDENQARDGRRLWGASS
jgi:hypothetical protein